VVKKAKERRSKPFYDLIKVQGERAIEFKAKNHDLLRIFNHMLGYAYITRQFMVAVDAAADTPEEISNRDRERHRMKVRLSLETTFNNSLYAAVRLLSFGMIREALSLVRTAYEALQYFRLLAFDDSAYDDFDTKPLRAVDVRKRLEATGHDPEPIRRRYGELSSASHLGGTGALEFSFEDLDVDLLRIGGYVDDDLQEEVLRDIILLTHLFQAFALGVSDENTVQYFDELRSALNGAEIAAGNIGVKVLELIEAHQFKPT